MKTLLLIITTLFSFNSFALINANPEAADNSGISIEKENEINIILDETIEDLFHLNYESNTKLELASVNELYETCRSYYKLERIPLDWNSNTMRADRLAHYERLINKCFVQLSR